MSKKQYELSQEDQFFHDMFMKEKADKGRPDDLSPTNWTAQDKKCAHSHPALKIVVGDKTYEIYGGACGSPIHKCDIYIGLDRYSMEYHTKQYPWQDKEVTTEIDILYPITDMSPPSDSANFKLMVAWICNQLQSEKKIHIGCIGGHGRTGTVLAAVVANMLGGEGAIQYVRKNYCDHAVESASQVSFLMKHFGCSKAVGYKEHGGLGFVKDWGSAMKGSQWVSQPHQKEGQTQIYKSSKAKTSFSGAKRSFSNVTSLRSIW